MKEMKDVKGTGSRGSRDGMESLKKKITLGLLALVAVLILAFLFARPSEAPTTTDTAPDTTAEDTIDTTILVEIERGTLYSHDATNKDAVSESDMNKVAHGREIHAPISLTTATDTVVTLYMPDSSLMRLDSETSITIDTATFDTKDSTLAVKTRLTFGRVWSNIVKLVTPRSSWEVETSHVVATVRGTAFSMSSTDDDETTIIGAKDTVTIGLIDEETGEREETNVVVDDASFFSISNEEVKEVLLDATDTTTKLLTTSSTTDELLEDGWHDSNTEKDAVVEEEIRKPNRGGGSGGLKDAIEAKIEATASETSSTETEDMEPAAAAIESVVTETAEPLGIPADLPIMEEPVVEPKNPESLILSTSIPLKGVTEGTEITLTATLTYDDGTTEDVTTDTAFEVVGSIGSMREAVFVPALGADVAEFGRSNGSIVGSWRDGGGESLIANTPVFEVEAFVKEVDIEELVG